MHRYALTLNIAEDKAQICNFYYAHHVMYKNILLKKKIYIYIYIFTFKKNATVAQTNNV